MPNAGVPPSGGDRRSDIAAMTGILQPHELQAFAPAVYELGARDGGSLSRLVESELKGIGASAHNR